MKQLLKKPQISLTILLTAFLTVLTLIFISLFVTLSNLETEDLISTRNLAVSYLTNQLDEIETVIYSVDSYISTQNNLNGLLSYLISIDENYPLISSIYLGFADKTMINSSGFTPPPTFDLTQRPWYQAALSTNDVVFTDAFINATQDRVIITAAYAVHVSGELIGVIGVDIDIQSMTSFINELKNDIGGYGFLFDNNENVIAHPDLTKDPVVLKSIEDFGIQVNSLTESSGITSEIMVNNVKGVIAYEKVPGTDFTFGVFKSSAVLHQSTKLIMYLGLAIAAVILGGTSALVIIYKYFINNPLNALVSDIRKIDIVNNGLYRLPDDKKAGFLDVRSELNLLVDTTIESQNQVKESLKELSISNQKYNLLLESASDLVFIVDKDMRYKEVFGKGLDIIEKNEKDFIGKKHGEVFPDISPSNQEENYRLAFNGEKSVYTWKYTVKDKTIVFGTALSPLYDIDKNIVGAVGVTRDITEQQRQYDNALYIATHDSLTDLYNRRYYIEKLEVLESKKAYPYAIMNLDVNGLKIFNDAYGHAVGDIALIKTAKVLIQTCPKEATVSRVSGDEFTIVLPNASEKTINNLIDQLTNNFSKISINNIKLSVAIGYFIKNDDSLDLDEARKLSENDMFRHKISERKSIKNRAISAILKTLTEKYSAEKVHSDRVCELSISIGKALKLNAEELKDLATAAQFHDIGKISIPDEIINKPGKLTPEEFEIIKTHTEIGYEILRAADEYSDLAIYASSHHERIDGKGYPKGLKGDEIPLFSRIIAIADSFEAMTSDRPYRTKQTNEYAISELKKYSGTQFDYDIAKLFVEKVLKEKWD